MSRSTKRDIPFARPSLGEEEEQAVIEVIRSGWLTTGRIAEAFEREFALLMNVPYALALNSATAGLHLALKSLEVPEGSLVCTSPFTFASVGEAARCVGSHPRFVDTEADSFNTDPDLVEKILSEKNGDIGAVIPVHIAGHVTGMRELTALGSQHDVPIIEDAAHALPAATEDGYAGTIGDAGVFSFYATKPITTGEGGMIVTRRHDVAEKIQVLRLHGIDRVIWDRYRSAGSAGWEYDVLDAGFKYNMTDMAAALGRVQLKKAEDLYRKRLRVARTYIEAFKPYDFLKLPPGWESPELNHAWHLFILRCEERRLSISRDEYIGELIDRGIGVSVHFKPLHLMSYYRKTYGLAAGDFPNALAHFQTCFSIPIYPDLSEEEIRYIIDQVIEVGSSRYAS